LTSRTTHRASAARALAVVVALARPAAGVPDGAAAGYRPGEAGLTAFRAGRYEEALADFRAELEAHPASSLLRFDLASAEFKLWRYTDAERDYLAASADLELRPLATLNAGLAAAAAGLHDTAAAYYRAVTTDEHAAVGAASPRTERVAQLLTEQTEERRGERRDTAWRITRLGRDRLKAGEVDAAVELLYGALDEAAAGSLPADDRAEMRYALAVALERASRHVEAVAELRLALAAKPDDADFHYLLGLALRALGRRQEAATELQAALAAPSESGLPEEDVVRARAYLAELSAPPAAIDPPSPAPPPRLAVDAALQIGYDTNYASGREVAFMKGVRNVSSAGAPELVLTVEPRLRLVGRPGNGLYLGGRVDALLYLSSDADPFSITEFDLYLEGSWSPAPWLTLSASAQPYLDLAGVLRGGLYQWGGELWGRATFWEGERFATRLRYRHLFMNALDPTYAYLGGNRDEAGIAELAWVGAWRLALGYFFRNDAVGMQSTPGAALLAPAADLDLRCQANLGRPCEAGVDPSLLPDPIYTIPWSYRAHDVGLDADGDLGWRLHLELGVHYQRREYLGRVAITPDPGHGYHPTRGDDRWAFDFSLRRELGWGIHARLSLYVLVSASNVDNSDPAYPFDYDDKNFTRVVSTVDLVRPF
jgi:tetratricopeptide (TPR) repeat protein